MTALPFHSIILTLQSVLQSLQQQKLSVKTYLYFWKKSDGLNKAVQCSFISRIRDVTSKPN